MRVAGVLVEDSALNLGTFLSSSAVFADAHFLRTSAASKWSKVRKSNLLLSNFSITDMNCNAEPGLISAYGGQITWSGGTLRNLWAKEQTLIKADGTKLLFSGISLSGFNATFIHDIEGPVDITDCHFGNGGIRLQRTVSSAKLYGAALHCIQCPRVTVARVSANNLSAQSGGAIYVEMRTALKFTVRDSSFENCTAAEKGGAIYSEQAQVNITGTRFSRNLAFDGGAIYITCNQRHSACLSNISECMFESNKAESGGGIRWKENRPIFTSVQYLNNSAVYGPDEASQASHLGLIDAVTLQPIESLQYLGVPGQRVPVPLLIGLIDTVGQLVATDDFSYVNIRESPVATFQGSTRLLAVSGVANYSAFVIKAVPGSILNIEAYTDEISTNSTNYERSNVLKFEYKMRNCTAGEHNETTSCFPCPKTSYSLQPQQMCTACPSTATCPGGAILDLDPGYWRSSNTSDRIEKCFLEEACKGGKNSECGEGYTSNLCGMCSSDWYRVAKVSCFQCGSRTVLTVRIVLLGAIYLAFIVFAVYFTLSKIGTSARSKSKEFSSLLKILIKYLQSMMLISGLKTEWSEPVLRMFECMEFFGSIVIGSFAPECYLSRISDIPIVYLKLIIVSAGLLGLIAALELLCIALRLVRVRIVRSYLCAVEVIFVLFLQPVQVKYAMNMLDCKSLDTGQWLISHMAEKCWEGSHSLYVFALALPSLIIFGFGTLVLLAAFLFLKKLRSGIAAEYLICGFCPKTYYWEIVHQAEKLGLAVAVATLGSTEPKIQILMVSIIVFSSLYAQKVQNPLFTAQSNSTNLYSICSVYAYVTLAFYTHYFGKSAPTIRDVLSYVSFASLWLFLFTWCVAVVKTVRNRRELESLQFPSQVHAMYFGAPNNSAISVVELSI